MILSMLDLTLFKTAKCKGNAAALQNRQERSFC